ncbi:SH3 9 and/or Cofilin ADF domain containing protein [Asbolus verrucosus]|uniref:SH3 9 and/or Cofilin ADF domain containing protein n=1 Tax=Asbolus verrucosus TaxID=1661398 RepID=A0A482VYK2_ASBVE|nr:SH3 9 and/or Cofilin ADF domain containing protein [Asbolus verrucosus]
MPFKLADVEQEYQKHSSLKRDDIKVLLKWLKNHPHLPPQVADMKGCALGHMIRMNLMALKQLMHYVQMKFHSVVIDLQKYIPKDCLPKDYGGEGPSIQVLHEENMTNILDNLDFFQWHDSQKVDETKRFKKAKVANIQKNFNLDKNRDELISAWKDVLDDKTATNWALFSYEGQTNVLKFTSKGSDGLEELTEDLNSGKIMYAFAKVNDPKTSLDKFVLINWQGEGANTMRKGISANHLRDIEKFFTGAHLTINARNEEEVEPQLIIEKVAKSGSAYSFKAPRAEIIEPTGPVGTTYQRVNPIKEINARERDQFWRKEEEEEKKRIEEERKRKESEKLKSEEELRRRELEETAKRDAETSLRNNNIDQIKLAEKEAAQAPPQANYGDFEELPQKVNQSEILRKQRKQEAQDLIAQRTIDARSIFEQHTAAGQIKKVPEKPVRNSILKAQAQAEIDNKQEEQSDDDSDQFSTIKRSPKDAEKKSVSTPTSPQDTLNEMGREEVFKDEPLQQITDQQFVDEYIYGFSTPGLQARALYDYQAADDTEITFDPGDIITNIDQVDEGWWQGLAPNGTYGLFPANYVELIQ